MNCEHLEQWRCSVRTPSSELSYVDVGEGPAAVFIHGVGTNLYLWGAVINEIARTRRCIALDLPLHGRSPAHEAQDLSIGGLADLVEEFCDAVEPADVDVVAHDTGGAVAQVAAARHPGRFRSLTLTNCDTHDNVPPEAFKPTVELARAGALAPLAPGLLADLSNARATVFATGYEDPEHLDLDMVRCFLEPVIGTPERARLFERMLAALEPSALLDAESALAELRVPTLVVWGTADEFFDLRWAYWLRDTIPGVTDVVELDGAKLFFPDERAAELVPQLLRHWQAADRRDLRAR